MSENLFLEVEATLEALLFVSGEPTAISELAKALELDLITTESSLRSLQIRLTERGSGLQLIRIANGWQLSTRPEYAIVIGKMLTRASNRLSRAAMETLAIIAYRQPLTTPEIEGIRGVSAAGVIKTLVEKRLIKEAGRKATPGRPMLYVTTPDFLHYFGIADISQLPSIDTESPVKTSVPAEQVTG